MTTVLRHACERCGGWIRDEHGLCGVCKAKDREWPSNTPIRRALDALEVLLGVEKLIARGDENEERSQWRRETYRECEKQISTMRFALEELELEHVEPSS